jgi:dolichol-phosphate mannosyltransferase
MSVARAVVCLPTYNERENLARVIDALEPLGVSVLVIDDSSPDGTGELADRLAAERDWVSVLHRERKEGLGPAYLAGFREVLRGDAEYVLEMDADLSHDPADVPRLIEASANGADLALGSRYVEGGGTENWGRIRRFVSTGGSFYARTLLGVPIRDLTGGFKCFRREALERIDLDSVHSKGYAFQIELTYRALRAGCTVVEVPIVFADRTHGDSKMSNAIFLEAVARVPALRLAAVRRRL